MNDRTGNLTHMQSEYLPKHIAIIMDGNGRWARKRFLPRAAGHKAGARAVRKVVECCVEKQIETLTLFAFSRENWLRPEKEVSLLMTLFINTLESEARKMHKNNIRLQIIGEKSAFSEKLQSKIREVEQLTAANTGLNLLIAANYGGQWDIQQAVQKLAQKVKRGDLQPEEISESLIASQLSFADLPDPDLFIRTGGEERISNFMLWQLSYTELHFSQLLWPEFGKKALENAIEDFLGRQRRFGKTGEQVVSKSEEESLKISC
jgi:undecaprenyl diphosphate synthase